jgi:hypothetical protein
VTAFWEKVETRWHEFVKFVNKPDDTRAVAIRWAIAILLFLVALLLLAAMNFLLRGSGLWGDLGFAIIITTAVFWALRRLAHVFLVEGDIKALPRAFATTIFVLVGVPVAWVTKPAGLVLLLLPVGIWALAQLVYSLRDGKARKAAAREAGPEAPPADRAQRKKRYPIFWQAEVAGVLLLGIVLFVAPNVGSPDQVALAVPAADLEGGEQDLAVAREFQPLLFFDSGERRYPLDIQDAIAANRMKMCRKAVGDDNCTVVESAEQIDEGQDYLELEEAANTPRGGGETSAIYAHVVRGGDLVYVDYWWFYSINPSPVADKVFCGPGFRWPPYTCQQHAGDWEGLTVVLGPCSEGDDDCEVVGDESLAPEEVRYGQHEFVVAYDWGELKRYWATLAVPRAAQSVQDAWEDLVLPAIGAAGSRTIAFAARNSHASYPNPCFGSCNQVTRSLPEGQRNGSVPWVHNESCDECVKPLPLTREGEPALWNAFPGHWGEQHCILAGAYCDLSGAPKGPSTQERYENPGEAPGHRVKKACLGALSRFELCSAA